MSVTTRLILKGGRVVDPATGRDGTFDVLIEDGVIRRIAKDLPVDGATVYDVPAGGIVAPGLIDIHVHLREPGQSTRKRWRPARRQRSPAVSRRLRACPTPTR